MPRPALEIADIFRDHGAAWRRANRGHVSHAQLKVMNAIEGCRTAALGGYVAHCTNPACSHTTIAYCSCRNRHCPRCQGSQASEWLEARKAELLEVPYFHVVFTLPPRIGAIAFQNKAVIYDLLFKASAETLLTIPADPKRLGAKIGFTSVLHTWGSAMTHHPHVHMIVPGGGISLDGARWISTSEKSGGGLALSSHGSVTGVVAAHHRTQPSFSGLWGSRRDSNRVSRLQLDHPHREGHHRHHPERPRARPMHCASP